MCVAVLQSPVREGQAQCWIPLVANHFPVSSPFTDAHGQPQPLTAAVANAPAGVAGLGMAGVAGVGVPTLPGMAGIPLTTLSSGLPGAIPVSMAGVATSSLQHGVPSSMALVPVPVIVPVLAPPPTLHQARNRSMRRAGAAAVKFDATPV